MSAAGALLAAGRVGFRHHLAFRSEVVLQLFSAALVAGLNGSLWTAATAARPVILGERGEVWRGLVLVSWAGVAVSATRVHEEIGARFRDGQIAADLLRPLSLQASTWARDAGRAMAAGLVNSVPLLGVLLLVVPLPGAAVGRAGWWVLSLVLAHACSFGVSFLIGLGAARLKNVVGLAYLKTTLASLLSGAVVPLELMPNLVQKIAFVLPFHAMARTPAAVLLGREPVGTLLAEQGLWAVGLWGLGLVGWRWVARSITVEGG